MHIILVQTIFNFYRAVRCKFFSRTNIPLWFNEPVDVRLQLRCRCWTNVDSDLFHKLESIGRMMVRSEKNLQSIFLLERKAYFSEKNLQSIFLLKSKAYFSEENLQSIFLLLPPQYLLFWQFSLVVKNLCPVVCRLYWTSYVTWLCWIKNIKIHCNHCRGADHMIKWQ